MKKTLITLAFILSMPFTLLAQGPNDTGNYYQSANGKSGAGLKTAMFNIIKNPSVTSYDGLIETYRTTDTRPDGYVRDWYSNATHFRHNTDKAGNYSKEGDVYNREHLVPQSWFSESSPMKCDAHHVVPTDGYVNNRRGSYPLGEVGTVTYQSANGYSKLGSSKRSGYSGTVFEPNDEVKGDIARAYFYMATCYENRISNWTSSGQSSYVFDGNTYPGLTSWTLQMMMEWSQLDPVDDVETARNAAVQAVQGNRNPFIDYPGLEEYIWGTKTSEVFDYTKFGSTSSNVAPPTFSPWGGVYTSAQTVAISTSTAGAAIYYTTDGSTPTSSGIAYTSPLTINETTTLKAIAIKDGESSSVTTSTYTIRINSDGGGEGYYTRISSSSEVESGKKYLIVYESSSSEGKAYNGISGTRGENGDVAIEDKTIDMTLEDNFAVPVVITKDGSYYTILDTKENVFLALNEAKNAINSADEASTDNARWSISVSSTAASVTNAALSNYSLRYNTSANIFRCYNGSQNAIALYKNNDQTTGISIINNDKIPAGNTYWYTIDGRKLNGEPTQHGVYIHKGKKVRK